MTADAEQPDRIEQEAAEWFALLQSGAATRADRQAWRAWHDSAEAHRAAGLGTTAVSPVAVRARVADPSHAGQHVAAAGALVPASWAVAWRAPEA